MILIPVHQKLSRQYFPFVTLALIVANIWVFVAWQVPDFGRQMMAIQYWLGSDLAKLETPVYRDYLEQHSRMSDLQRFNDQDGMAGPINQGYLIDSDQRFQAAVADLMVSSSEYAHWRDLRSHYESVRGDRFTDRYLFYPDQIMGVGILSAMFLHGGVGHLIGNMIMLALLGFALECALKRWAFLAAYLGAGLGGGLLYATTAGAANTPSLGASGAIAGLMGLYAVLYGFRPVKFFFWVFVYFAVRKAPAIWFLPVWLLWEILQSLLLDNNVAYSAHIGGIATGALIGLGLRKLGQDKSEYLDHDVNLEKRQALYTQGKQYLADMNAGQAASTFQQLLEMDPDDIEVLVLCYRAHRLARRDATPYALALLDHMDHPRARAALVELYDKRLEHKGGLKLSIASWRRLATILIDESQYESAVNLLEKLRQSPKPVDGLDMLYARILHRAPDSEPDIRHHAKCALEQHFPDYSF